MSKRKRNNKKKTITLTVPEADNRNTVINFWSDDEFFDRLKYLIGPGKEAAVKALNESCSSPETTFICSKAAEKLLGLREGDVAYMAQVGLVRYVACDFPGLPVFTFVTDLFDLFDGLLAF